VVHLITEFVDCQYSVYGSHNGMNLKLEYEYEFEEALHTPGWAPRCAIILFVHIKNCCVPDSTVDKTSLESVTRPINMALIQDLDIA